MTDLYKLIDLKNYLKEVRDWHNNQTITTENEREFYFRAYNKLEQILRLFEEIEK